MRGAFTQSRENLTHPSACAPADDSAEGPSFVPVPADHAIGPVSAKAYYARGVSSGMNNSSELRHGPRISGADVSTMPPMAQESFSVLLPVYAGDSSSLLLRAFESVTIQQERRPDEVVIVRDGPLPPAFQTCLEDLVKGSAVPVTVVELPENRGLGIALQEGISRCRYDIVARMDADDVSLPGRFARQIPLVESGFDVVGSALAELKGDESSIGFIRRRPLSHEEIVRFARFHSPFNHPTVVLRRSVVVRAGGYEHLPSFEDYWLWVRMLAGGARAANVAEPLLLYRVSTGAFDRRGGTRLIRPEIELQRRMRRLGFTSRAQFARNLAVRVAWRLVPVSIRRRVYGRVFGHKSGGLPVADRT